MAKSSQRMAKSSERMTKSSERMTKSFACLIQSKNLNVVNTSLYPPKLSKFEHNVCKGVPLESGQKNVGDKKRLEATSDTTRRRPFDLQLACFYRCCHLFPNSKMAPYSITAAGVLELGLQLHNFRYSARKEDQPQQATKFRKLYGVDAWMPSKQLVVAAPARNGGRAAVST
jgi:hypothetical protein